MITTERVAPTSSLNRDKVIVPFVPVAGLSQRLAWLHKPGHGFKVDGAELLADAFGSPTAHRMLERFSVENLAAGADITARALMQFPVAATIHNSVKAIWRGNSAGVDGSNTVVLTLRNITAGVDIATVTLTGNVVANAAAALTLTTANATPAANDIIGLVVTQGATADLDAFEVQFEWSPNTSLGAVSAFALVAPSGSAIVVAPAVTVHSTPEQLAVAAFKALVADVMVEKAAATGITFSAAHVVSAGKYGIILLQMSTAGAISSKVPLATQAYNSAGEALANLPAVDSGKLPFARIIIQAKAGAAWTANTDDMTAASDLETIAITNYAAVTPFLALTSFVANKRVEATVATNDDAVGRATDTVALFYTADSTVVRPNLAVNLSIRGYPANGEVMTKAAS